MRMLRSREVNRSHSYKEEEKEFKPNSVLLQNLGKLYGMLPHFGYNETAVV